MTKTIKCTAIDDEPMALIIIEQFCKRHGGMELSAYSEPSAGLKAIRNDRPDLVFLDIQMNCIDGLEIAASLPKDIPFIFTTAHARYALEGFELDAVDFLHKPFSYERFAKAVDKAVMRISASSSYPASIVVKEEYSNTTVALADILYIEAVGNYVKIFRTDGRNVLSRMKMKDIMSLLPGALFVRVHRSFIVSVSKIERYNKSYVCIKDTQRQIPVGKSYLEDFEKRVADM